ncbi:TerB family tellurite resistance protein [Pelagibacterium limicola]|uniref:tellurite resistance TerB family protein n=1 Tax=Pelagibacterium limicola TaxID=2791022 RepID=UPI0018AF65B2|nr:TerB family tellurite resistance protein [Pelagibacterium limicola]
MFDAIAKLFGAGATPANAPIEPRLAVAALLVHLATVDGSAKPEELRTISFALKDHYGLSDTEVAKLVQEAKRKDREAVDFYQFTSRLARLESNEKIAIIRMMWQVVFADDTNHELEDNMVWRVAELIGVSARERTVLRNQIRKSGAQDLETHRD